MIVFFSSFNQFVSYSHNLKNKLTGETLDGKDLFTLIQITYSTFATENNLQKKLIELFPALKVIKLNIHADKDHFDFILILLFRSLQIIVLDNLSGNLTIKMFTDLLTSLQVGTSNKIKKQVFPLLIQCLRREPKTFEAWKELYGRTSEQVRHHY